MRLSLTQQRWTTKLSDAARVSALAQSLDISPILAQCLIHRATTDRVHEWLEPSPEHLHDPMLMSGMAQAVARVRQAIEGGENVRLVTDYDVDGTTSCLILRSTLLLLQASGRIDHHIPDRQHEGYGFSLRAAEQAIADGVNLLITADIGVRDHEAVSAAASGGVDVIICDHHLPAGAQVPADALAVLCPPQADCSYPNPALAACGVSLKLAEALLNDHHPKAQAILTSMLKVAAIGTVADVVDLSTPENRAIVALGVEELRRGPHTAGLQALLDVADVGSEVTSEDLGFKLGPRINAAGRLAQADAVLTLLSCRDRSEARRQAEALDTLNRDRQGIQRTLVKECLSRLSDPPPGFVVLWGEEAEGWHRGVVGIVAAKVRDKVHRPAAVIAVAGDDARGSVRAPPGVHAVRALDSVADLLLAHGGHPAAAGFSARAADLPELSRRLDAYVQTHTADDDLVPTLQVEAICTPSDLGPDLAQALSKLAPFGKGNPPPLLQLDGVKAEQIRPMGQGHLRMTIGGVDTVWWGGADHRAALDGVVDVVGTLGFNHWRGRSTVRLTIKDARACP